MRFARRSIRPTGRSAIGASTRWTLVATLVLLLTSACVAAEPEARKEASQAPEPSVLLADTTGAFPFAGISMQLELDITPIDISELEGDTVGRPFHLLMERCGGCHSVPAPASKSPGEWADVLERMHANALLAGLMPSSTSERELIVGYLERHAR